MAGPNKKDRISPPLMFAFREAFRQKDSRKKLDLRDDTGERMIAGRRSRASVTEAVLRRDLAEDLSGLLNTINLGSAEDLSEFSFVSRSILNYGLTDLTGYTLGEAAIDELSEELRIALTEHEPRLINESVEVKQDETLETPSQKLRFLVSAEMHASPVDIPVEFVAELELDSGTMRIAKL